MNARVLFISDIHGQLDALKALLDKVNYDASEDRLLLLGDYTGNSKQNLLCLQYIKNLLEYDNVAAIMGNHDRNLYRYLQHKSSHEGREDASLSLATLQPYLPDLITEVLTKLPEIESLLESMPLWYESADFVAVHAGINPNLPDWRQSTPDECTTIREPFLSSVHSVGKTVIFGHTPCIRLHGSPDIWFGHNKIGIDGGAGKDMQLNCLILTDEGFSQRSVPIQHA
ncbi:metallophosphoesterase [Alicyclobacillus sp. SO9]|nr:metallophosphoesterase [Alicyclobacillus sp. SO9]